VILRMTEVFLPFPSVTNRGLRAVFIFVLILDMQLVRRNCRVEGDLHQRQIRRLAVGGTSWRKTLYAPVVELKGIEPSTS
jgi:hypothetical protein